MGAHHIPEAAEQRLREQAAKRISAALAEYHRRFPDSDPEPNVAVLVYDLRNPPKDDAAALTDVARALLGLTSGGSA